MNYVCCPVCGAVLQKSSIALAEVKCSNCRTVLKIYVNNGIVVVGKKDKFDENSIFCKMLKEMKIE